MSAPCHCLSEVFNVLVLLLFCFTFYFIAKRSLTSELNWDLKLWSFWTCTNFVSWSPRVEYYSLDLRFESEFWAGSIVLWACWICQDLVSGNRSWGRSRDIQHSCPFPVSWSLKTQGVLVACFGHHEATCLPGSNNRLYTLKSWVKTNFPQKAGETAPVKHPCWSSKGPEFSSENPSQAAHKCL